MDKNVNKALIKNWKFWSTEIRKNILTFPILRKNLGSSLWNWKKLKVKQKCYRGFSLWQRFYMFQIWADILKNVWFQEWVEFTDQLQDAHVIPIVSSTKYFTWASESQFPFCQKFYNCNHSSQNFTPIIAVRLELLFKSRVYNAISCCSVDVIKHCLPMTVTILMLGKASGSMFPVIITRLKRELTVTLTKKQQAKQNTACGRWVQQPFSGQGLTIQMLSFEMSFGKQSLLMFVVAFRGFEISLLILTGLRTFHWHKVGLTFDIRHIYIIYIKYIYLGTVSKVTCDIGIHFSNFNSIWAEWLTVIKTTVNCSSRYKL